MAASENAYRTTSELRILIVGGGIAGLTLAALLRQRGLRPVVIEQAQAYAPVGYVLTLWPAGGRILKGLGLHERFVAAGLPMRRYNVAGEDGRVIRGYDLDAPSRTYGPLISIARADLLEVLRAGLLDAPIRMGTTVAAIVQDSAAVSATFSDGTRAEFDLVVGADGLRSRVRELVFGRTPLRYAGVTGWAFWIEPEFEPPDEITEYWGAGHFFGVYPAKGRLAAFVALAAPANAPDPPTGRIERIRREFGHLGGIVPQILTELREPESIHHDDFNDLKMKLWRKGRVVLIGDSSHGILPTGGVGASLAMESAAALADELSRADSRDLELALDRYVRRRRPRVDRIQAQSRLMGRFMLIRGRRLSAMRNWLLRFYSDQAMLRYWSAILNEPI